MRPAGIREFLTCTPFQPFQITLTDGRTYDVGHPELAMVGRSSVVIGMTEPRAKEPVYDRFVTVSMLHIMQIAPLEAADSP